MKHNTIGFPISDKEKENRRALLPGDIADAAVAPCLFFESGYGKVLGIEDAEYLARGARVCGRAETLAKDVICDLKLDGADYLPSLKEQTLFGWPHAVQTRAVVDAAVAGGLTVYAWEDMFENGRHVFSRNNELAGEAAVLHALPYLGMAPEEARAAVLGNGNAGMGAIKILHRLGLTPDIYHPRNIERFSPRLSEYDLVVNAVLWRPGVGGHLIARKDLKRMKPGALIIDVSCDRGGAVETCEPRGVASPVYRVDGILHYAVDHTPSILYKTASASISRAVWPYIRELCLGAPSPALERAKCIERGTILDRRIIEFQGREG